MRRIGHIALALALLAVAHLSVPRPVVACRCVAPDVSIDSAGQDRGASVFTATAGVRTGDSIPVTIMRWLKGVPPAGPATIEGEDPRSLCGPTSPPAGGHYLFVTYTSKTSPMAISGCSVQADLATPEGAALLARATRLFGPGTVPATQVPSPPPQVAAAEQRPISVAMLVWIAVAVLSATGLIAGLFVATGRRRHR